MVGKSIWNGWKREKQSSELPEHLVETKAPKHLAPDIKTLDEMLWELDEIERLWIEIYIDLDFNYSEIERQTGIDRRSAKKRINNILIKWKHLDIYLQR